MVCNPEPTCRQRVLPDVAIPAELEASLRLGVFATVFATMAVLEIFWPRRQRQLPRGQRWLTNATLVALDTLALRVVLPVLAVGTAELAATHHWGLLNRLALPPWAAVALAVIALDALVYLQHVVSHRVPMLWRFHKVHHADRDIDVTTGARFHPVEILASMLFKMLCVGALGAPAVAVIVFEIVLNASALFNHANVKLPVGLDRWLRLWLVTPDMHRVHHSTQRHETNSNYGFCLPWWDRLFGTYVGQPAAGHAQMTIGLAEFQDARPARLGWSLVLPFLRRDAATASHDVAAKSHADSS